MLYITPRKPFIGNLRGKIERQKLSNRFRFMAQLTTDWIDTQFTKDRLKTILKTTFFNYKKTAWLLIVMMTTF